LKLERVTGERNEAIDKFSESERIWRQKQQRQEREGATMMELNC